MPIFRPQLNYLTSNIRLCIHQADDVFIQGQVYTARLSAPLTFTDLGLLLLQLEALMDVQNLPQSFQRVRQFRKGQTLALPEELTEEPGMPVQAVQDAQGELATFDLHVLSRQNTSWQGRLTYYQNGEEMPPLPFQSELELMRIVCRLCHLQPTEA